MANSKRKERGTKEIEVTSKIHGKWNTASHSFYKAVRTCVRGVPRDNTWNKSDRNRFGDRFAIIRVWLGAISGTWMCYCSYRTIDYRSRVRAVRMTADIIWPALHFESTKKTNVQIVFNGIGSVALSYPLSSDHLRIVNVLIFSCARVWLSLNLREFQRSAILKRDIRTNFDCETIISLHLLHFTLIGMLIGR